MQEAESIPEAAFRDSKLVFCKGSKVYKLALRLKTLPKRYFQVRCQITCGRAWAGIATHWLAQPGHMGFKADADQGTGNEQAGQTKLQNRAPLPVEKPEQNQQSAMEVIGQIQKDAARGERIPPNLAFLDTHQAPCMVVVGQHFKDGRFMATFLNQVIAWANKACDNGYPDTCLQWAGFLAKLAIHYDRVSAGHADVGIMNRLTSRARSIKALAESRASERMSKGERVHGVTGVLIEWGMDEYRLIETVTERLRTVNDAIRCLDLLSNASAAAGIAPAVVPVPIKVP